MPRGRTKQLSVFKVCLNAWRPSILHVLIVIFQFIQEISFSMCGKKLKFLQMSLQCHGIFNIIDINSKSFFLLLGDANHAIMYLHDFFRTFCFRRLFSVSFMFSHQGVMEKVLKYLLQRHCKIFKNTQILNEILQTMPYFKIQLAPHIIRK